MGNLFSMNGKFYHFMCKVADCIILSVLWLVCSLPLVTLGASSSALYYGVLRSVRKEEGSAARFFFRGFRDNWKQGTVVTVIMIAFAWVIFFLAYTTQGKALVILIALCVLFLAWLHYLLSYIARFQAPMKKVLVNTLAICLANLPASLSMVALLIVTVLALVWTFPASAMTLLLIPAVYTLVSSFLLERVYRKYLPEGEESAEKAAEREEDCHASM